MRTQRLVPCLPRCLVTGVYAAAATGHHTRWKVGRVQGRGYHPACRWLDRGCKCRWGTWSGGVLLCECLPAVPRWSSGGCRNTLCALLKACGKASVQRTRGVVLPPRSNYLRPVIQDHCVQQQDRILTDLLPGVTGDEATLRNDNKTGCPPMPQVARSDWRWSHRVSFIRNEIYGRLQILH